MKVTITGYEESGKCDHCGRSLKHVIKLSNGQLVGSTCFANLMTEPKIHMGRKYRVSPTTVRELAQVAEFWSADKQSRNGYSAASFLFELK